MKKKVALLLALVMVLSMLPMNVFGVNATPVGTVVNPGISQSENLTNLHIQVPMSVFGGQTQLELRLTLPHRDGNAGFAVPVQATLATSPVAAALELVTAPMPGHEAILTPTGGANFVPDAAVIMTSTTVRGAHDTVDTIRILIERPDALLPTAVLAASFSIAIPVLLNHHDIEISGVWSNDRPFPTTQLMQDRPDQNITITTGDPASFVDLLVLGNVTINENRPGLFGGNGNQFIVRLEAPAGYRWFESNGASIEIVDALRWGSSNATLTHLWTGQEQTGVTRQVAYYRVNMSGNETAFARSFHIQGLQLIPELNNNRLGAVVVEVATMPVSESVIGGWETGRRSRPANDTFEGGLYRVASLEVGNRVVGGLEMVVLGADEDDFELPELRTGFLNLAHSEAISDTLGSSVHARELGLRTATIEIREIAPGIWPGHRLGDRLEFRFEQEGVAIVGAAARAGDNGDRNNNFGWSGGFLTTQSGSLQTLANDIILESQTSYTATVVSENLVTVSMPRSGLTDSGRRAVQVTFWISIEAGFEAANPNADIELTVSGAGAQALPATDRTIAVATPVDPISLRVVGGETLLPADLAANTVAGRPVNNIEITINDPSLLNADDLFALSVTGLGVNRLLGLHLAAAREALVGGEGLVVSNVALLNDITAQGAQGFSDIGFTIVEIPDEDMNDGAVTITLQGVHVTGTVVPGVQYYVVVSGGIVAENVGNRVGMFLNAPYAQEIISNARDDGGAGNIRVGEVVISIHDRLPGVDQEPITFRTIAGQNVGLVSMRAFAYLIGGEAVPNYPTTGDWTINGVSVAGEVVQITVNDNSPSVRVLINGVLSPETDLSRWAGPLTGVPHGQLPVLNLNGNVFLPFRAMANIFGYDVEMVTSFSIRFFS